MDIDISSRFSRLFVQVQDENKFKRKQALEAIMKEALDCSQTLDSDMYLCQKIIHSIFDQGESNREIVCSLLEKIVTRQKNNLEKFLPIILPEFFKKLSDKDNIDPSEEIRMHLMNILYFIVCHSKKSISLYIQDCLMICCNTLIDNYSEIKRITCYVITEMSKLNDYNFYNNSEILIKPLINNLCHQHSKVRVDTINCIGSTLLSGSVKSFDSVCSSLAQRLFDDNVNVRKSVIEVFGTWLLDLRDRYSFHPKLIPVLLSGYFDENEEISELTEDLWHDIGIKFQQENENDLKEQIDFEEPVLQHYPKEYKRPNLGCRTLMFRNLSKILPPLTRDLGDWSEQTRIKASALLPYLIINAEGACTQHCQLLIGSTIIRGLVDDEALVRQACRTACTLLGYFIKPEVWWKIIKGVLGRCDVDDKFISGQLILLACIMGSTEQHLLADIQTIQEIVNFLRSSQVAGSHSTKIKSSGLHCILTILDQLDSSYSNIYDTVGYDIFYAAFALSSYKEKEIDKDVTGVLESQFDSIMEALRLNLGLTGWEEVYERYLDSILNELLIDRVQMVECEDSIERLMITTVLLRCVNQLGGHLDLLIPQLGKLLDCEKDINLRVEVFVALVRIMANLKLMASMTTDLLSTLLFSVILPNMMWRAGRTAEALRRIAATCLWTVLVTNCKVGDRGNSNNDDNSNDHYNIFYNLPNEVNKELLTRLLAALDDDLTETRLVCSRALVVFLDIVAAGKLLSAEKVASDQLHNMYPVLLKRMDDPLDDIRILTTRLFSSWINCLKEDFEEQLYRGHLEELNSGLLVHLDDANPDVQNAVYTAMLDLAQLSRSISEKEINSARLKHRSTYLCDKLLNQIKQA